MTDPAKMTDEEIAQKLRDTATGIEMGFVADPKGDRVGLLARHDGDGTPTLDAPPRLIQEERR